jgi:hypothetical protein
MWGDPAYRAWKAAEPLLRVEQGKLDMRMRTLTSIISTSLLRLRVRQQTQ